MSHQEKENQGTGLSVVFDILVKAPPERLQSLTVQLGESPEDNIIHILCLVILRREAEALNKIQELRDNRIAEHLSEKLQSGGNLEDFGDHCGRFEEFIGETPTTLARIFKVLSEQRLCDAHLTNLAYRRALSANSQKTSSNEDLDFRRLFEEAKVVCGTQVAESMSMKDLKSQPYHDSHRSLNGGNITLEVSLDQSERPYSLPSPLQAGSIEVSYPSHLEISMPPTVSYKGDKGISDISDKSNVNTPNGHQDECEAETAKQPFGEPAQFKAKETSMLHAAPAKTGTKLSVTTPKQNTKPSIGIKVSMPSLSNTPLPHEMQASASVEEEEEAIFYAFVILNAPEDVDMAENIKARMEVALGSKGAVFSEDFTIPGRSTLKCVEDAINNSAFTLLLLTRNFNTRMLELKTDSALINSINKEHKYNTVIPLLPKNMPLKSMPLVLATINALRDDGTLERKIKKAMSPANINRLKKIWTEEQRVKRQLERQDFLKQLNQFQKQLIQECKTAELLEKENMRLKDLLVFGSEQRSDSQASSRQLPPNIHIENAQYIMIGNDSQMTVDSGGGVDKDDEVDKDQEQEDSFSESA